MSSAEHDRATFHSRTSFVPSLLENRKMRFWNS